MCARIFTRLRVLMITIGTDPKKYKELIQKVVVRRIICGSTLDEVLAKNLVISTWMPHHFVEYMSAVLKQVVKDHATLAHSDLVRAVEGENEILCHITLDTATMWQQVDRRVDEYVCPFANFHLVIANFVQTSRARLELRLRELGSDSRHDAQAQTTEATDFSSNCAFESRRRNAELCVVGREGSRSSRWDELWSDGSRVLVGVFP